MSSRCFTYILQCSNGVLYTGYTTDMERRLNQHNTGKGAKFTRGRGPFDIVYLEEFSSKREAMTREAEIKRLPRMEKLKLIAVINDDGKYKNEPK